MTYHWTGGGSLKEYRDAGKRKTHQSNLPRWGRNPNKDRVLVKLDCENWIISFAFNGKTIATTPIEKNRTYYPALEHCGGCDEHDIDLKLL